MISITTVLQIHMHEQANTYVLRCSGPNAFINFLTSVHRHGERDTILTMLTPSPRAVHLVVFKISVSKDPKILTTAATVENSTLCPNGRELNCLPPWSNVYHQLTLFSKSLNSQDHHFRAWRHPHSSLISCLGFIMTIVIVISFARERKTAPNDYALN